MNIRKTSTGLDRQAILNDEDENIIERVGDMVVKVEFKDYLLHREDLSTLFWKASRIDGKNLDSRLEGRWTDLDTVKKVISEITKNDNQRFGEPS